MKEDLQAVVLPGMTSKHMRLIGDAIEDVFEKGWHVQLKSTTAAATAGAGSSNAAAGAASSSSASSSSSSSSSR
jgi:hypothetical protein